jgi:hypothetical protein
VTRDHERIEELLAGYALLGLTGEDAIDADRLLSEHVPTCLTCRDTLAGLQAVTGELALAADPIPPPDLLLPRIRRELDLAVPQARRRGNGRLIAAAGVVAVVSLAALSVSLSGRVSRTEAQRGQLVEALTAMQQPGANPVSLQPKGFSSPGLMEVSGPDLERVYIVGHGVPQPAEGYAYQLWLGSAGTFQAVGRQFIPDELGLVILSLTFDPSPYDEILITEEPAGATPERPSEGAAHVWSAAVEAAA